MTKCIYGIYDTEMSEFTQVVLLEDGEVFNYFSHIANDVQSPYFRKESNFKVYRLYDLNGLNGNDVYVSDLDKYVDLSVRNLQVITQTLNYLPLGFFKMPKEMQETVHEQIKSCVFDYVSHYLTDDEKLEISKVVKEN